MNGPAQACWDALGTTATIVVTEAAALAPARAAVHDVLDAIDRACSRFRSDSELMRLNETAGSWVPVSPLLMAALSVALRAAELTAGAVDPTVGAALVRAGYDRDFAAVPTSSAAPVASARVPGARAVRLDRARGLARVARGSRLDLGATAKALAADQAAAAAARVAPGTGVLVNLGGDIATAGPPPAGGWPVRVADDHRAAVAVASQMVWVSGGALATSSTTVRRWGTAAHHIIDPETGAPAISRWRTASVAAATCVDANIASTAAIVRDADAPAWLAARSLPARLVDDEGAVVAVANWPAEVAVP